MTDQRCGKRGLRCELWVVVIFRFIVEDELIEGFRILEGAVEMRFGSIVYLMRSSGVETGEVLACSLRSRLELRGSDRKEGAEAIKKTDQSHREAKATARFRPIRNLP